VTAKATSYFKSEWCLGRDSGNVQDKKMRG